MFINFDFSTKTHVFRWATDENSIIVPHARYSILEYTSIDKRQRTLETWCVRPTWMRMITLSNSREASRAHPKLLHLRRSHKGFTERIHLRAWTDASTLHDMRKSAGQLKIDSRNIEPYPVLSQRYDGFNRLASGAFRRCSRKQTSRQKSAPNCYSPAGVSAVHITLQTFRSSSGAFR